MLQERIRGRRVQLVERETGTAADLLEHDEPTAERGDSLDARRAGAEDAAARGSHPVKS